LYKVTQKMLTFLDRKQKQKLFILIAINLIAGTTEVIGVISFFPFMTLVGDPNLATSNEHLQLIFSILSLETIDEYLIFLGILTFIAVFITISFRTLATFCNMKFAQFCEAELASKLLSISLNQNYSWHIANDPRVLSKSILAEINQIVNKGLLALVQLFTGLFVSFQLFLLMAIVDTTVALTLTLVIGSFYGAVYFFVKGYVRRSGDARVLATSEKYKLVQDSLNNIKFVKIHGQEGVIKKQFKKAANQLAEALTLVNTVKQVPRALLELLAVLFLISMIIIFIRMDGYDSVPLGIMTVYALGAYRIMPSLQTVFSSYTSIKFSQKAAEAIFSLFKEDLLSNRIESNNFESEGVDDNFLQGDIELSKIGFYFGKKLVINDLSLLLKQGERVAIIGSSGCGKTTLLDIVCGLIFPSRGSIKVGDKQITMENIISWQRSLFYTPQEPYILNGSLAQNITLKDSLNEYENIRLHKVVQRLGINTFIDIDDIEKNDGLLGGVAFGVSGGQAQRIGIARALYSNKPILIFDEATSSLDIEGEKNIIGCILKESKGRTVIVVSHNIPSLKHFDRIVMLRNGAIVVDGTYNQLLRDSPEFRRLANVDGQ